MVNDDEISTSYLVVQHVTLNYVIVDIDLGTYVVCLEHFLTDTKTKGSLPILNNYSWRS